MPLEPEQELAQIRRQTWELIACLSQNQLLSFIWSCSGGHAYTFFPAEPLPIPTALLLNYASSLSRGTSIYIQADGSAKPWLGDLPPLEGWLLLPAVYQQEYLGGVMLKAASPSYQCTQSLLQNLHNLVDYYGCSYYGLIYRLDPSSLRFPPAAPMMMDLSYLHHELRTPLTSILGFSRMLKNELYGPLNEKQKQYIQAIAGSGDYLLSLVNDVLDWSKLVARQEELCIESVAVEELCQATLFLLKEKAHHKGIHLELILGEGVTLCRVDSRRLQQILLNLLSNAIKFTEKGSVTLKVEHQEECLTFAVIDTGIGIPWQEQGQLFRPFHQITPSLNRQEKGTGLGLALSRKLAQLHGGDIICQSQPGKGSCFILYLPLVM
jgi:hypothetical protein